MADLVQQAQAVREMQKRISDNKIRYYHPCCVKHGGRMPDNWPDDLQWIPKPCPTFQCPDSKHVKFHSSKARQRFVFGGNRASKTFTLTKEAVFLQCFKVHPYTGEKLWTGRRNGRILAQDYALITEKHLPELKEWIPKSFLKYADKYPTKEEAFDKSYDSRHHILYLKNGHIDFKTYDQEAEKGASVDLHWVLADEEMPRRWYSESLARLITTNGKLICGVTPLYKMTWAMDFRENTAKDVEVFFWEMWDNPYVSLERGENFLDSQDPMEREARETGLFLDFQGLVYKELDKSVHLVEPPKVTYSSTVFCAIDPHQRKGTFVVWATLLHDRTVVVFDELFVKGPTTVKEAVRQIKLKETMGKFTSTIRYIDPASYKQFQGYGSEVTTLDEFEKEGMHCVPADNSDQGYTIVREYLTFDKRQPINSLNQPRLYFSRNCSATWKALSGLMWDEWASKKEVRDPKETIKDLHKDFPDCVRYIIVNRPGEYVPRDPVPLRFSATPVQ